MSDIATMKTLSRKSSKSSDFADDTTLKDSPTSVTTTPAPRLKIQPCYNPPEQDPTSYLTAGLKRSLTTPQFTDLTLHCRSTTHRIHRIIAAIHSTYFHTILSQNPHQTTLDLSPQSPQAVTSMINYFYTLEYPDFYLGSPTPQGYTIYTLLPHVDVYVLAKRFGIPGLAELAVRKFEARARGLLVQGGNGRERFFMGVRVVYAVGRSLDRGKGEGVGGGYANGDKEGQGDELKKVVVRLCVDFAGELVGMEDDGGSRGKKRERGGFWGLLDGVPGFRGDFLREVVGRLK